MARVEGAFGICGERKLQVEIVFWEAEGVIGFPRGIFSQETMMKLGNITNNANWVSVFGVAENSNHRFFAVGIMV